MGEAYVKSRSCSFDTLSYSSGVQSSPPFGGPVPFSVQQRPTNLASLVDSLSGEKNPKWRDQVRQGIGATTPCSGTRFTLTPGRHAYGLNVFELPPVNQPTEKANVTYGNAVWQITSIPFNTIPTVPIDVMTRVTNRVISRFIAQAQDSRTAFEAGQDLGEYKETLNTIRRPMHSLRNKLLHYISSLTKAKTKVRGVHNLRKVLADTYLEFRFGVNPLAMDVADAIAKVGSFRFDVVPLHASSSEDYASTVSRFGLGIPSDPLNSLGPTASVKDYSHFQLRYKGAIRTGADPNGKASLAQELQLLPRDWLPTAWDLLPYSWIADYFTNIGDIIRSLCFVFNDITWANRTSRTFREQVYNSIGLSTPNNFHAGGYRTVTYTTYMVPARSTFRMTKFQRDKLTPSDLLPRFTISLPFSYRPWENLSALVFSRAKKIVPFF